MPTRTLPLLLCAAALTLAGCDQNKPTNTDLPTEAGATMPAEPVATTSPGAAAIAAEPADARGTGPADATPTVDPAAPQDPAR